MSLAAILLVGAGGHARACIDVIEQEGRFEVAGLVGLPNEVGRQVFGYPILGSDVDIPGLLEDRAHALVTVGQIRTPELRIRLFKLLHNSSAGLPVVVSPRAYVSPHATLGNGTIVMHGAVVNAGAVVGQNCIINNQALVEHDAVIGDHCHISTAASINGAASVEGGSFVGSRAVVRESIRIGEGSLIGMGQVVIADCDASTCFPAAKTPG